MKLWSYNYVDLAGGDRNAASCPTPSPCRQRPEAPAVALQHCGRIGPVLPTLNDHVDVLGVELDQARMAPGLLSGDQSRARAAERVEHDVAALA